MLSPNHAIPAEILDEIFQCAPPDAMYTTNHSEKLSHFRVYRKKVASENAQSNFTSVIGYRSSETLEDEISLLLIQ